MEMYSLIIGVIGLILEAALILRGRRSGLLRQFSLFYSYITFYFSVSLAIFLIYWLRQDFYPLAYWFCYLVSLLAEFAILLEISDHIFEPYAAIRQLGRFLTVCICAVLCVLYILPSFLHQRSTSEALLEFSLRTSLTKVVIICALAAAARYFRLPLGRNVAGLMMGFGLYLSVYMANFAAAQSFGRALYADILRFIGPLGSILCLAVWTVAMWQPASVSTSRRKLGDAGHRSWEELSYKLVRFNRTLTRLLRK